jgi:hypothetical protein
MKRHLNLFAAAALAASGAAAPALAQPPPGVYWSGDICHAAQAHEARKGTAIGAIAGGVLGAAVTKNRAAGALIGGSIGAVAGHAIGKSQVQCIAYPPRYSRRHGCQWVQENYQGRWHQFEVCQGRDGYWRPSGR